MKDKGTGASKGFGFGVFRSEAAALHAAEVLHDRMLKARSNTRFVRHFYCLLFFNIYSMFKITLFYLNFSLQLNQHVTAQLFVDILS